MRVRYRHRFWKDSRWETWDLDKFIAAHLVEPASYGEGQVEQLEREVRQLRESVGRLFAEVVLPGPCADGLSLVDIRDALCEGDDLEWSDEESNE
jgi:hypothetical protein